MVTPGVAVDDTLLDRSRNNYLASVVFTNRDYYGVAFLDISTGEFMVSEGDRLAIEKLFQSFQPAEVLYPRSRKNDIERIFGNAFYSFGLDDWVYTEEYCSEKIRDHFNVLTLKGFSIEGLSAATMAAGAALQYLSDTSNDKLQHIRSISRLHPDDFLWMDRFTIRNLELSQPAHPTGKALIDVIDSTVSPLGSRLLKKWLLMPLKSLSKIKSRQQVVQHFIAHSELSETLSHEVRLIGDLERIVSRISMAKVSPREFRQLAKALHALVTVQKCLTASSIESLGDLGAAINLCDALSVKIESAVVDEPPVNIAKGDVFKDGYHTELDELRFTMRNSKELLVQIQQNEAEQTGISSLKIGYNNVFGYYLEVTNKYKDQGLIPENWVRKQTLTNSERYITDELKKLEQKILGAEERILEIESELYSELMAFAQDFIGPLQHDAGIVARLDCMLSFAKNAERFDYVKPEMHEEGSLEILGGRHPVIERELPLGESYIPNDVQLDCEQQQILIITGPNMSGKSAVLRQTALISILAQMGSFVPAKAAKLGVLDRLFTRVGASDNISSGESTFMVEMNETAIIMNNISSRSLVLLDEIGRGTSTYDGISIAWSVAEYLHNNPYGRPMTLFATHYHELNDLADSHERIRNYHISTREVGNNVLFLRKLLQGGTEHSFGIHVARMAGMPRSIVSRASEILHQLESKALEQRSTEPDTSAIQAPSQMQLSIFEQSDPVAGRIKEMLLDCEVNRMTPIDCMLKLIELQKVLDDEQN